MAISQPQNLLEKPFANDGDFRIIPEANAGTGRASLSQGFPVETQRPLEQGGIAPNRTDFNGILYMLSAAMFWQQSGGQWTYLNTLNYAVPCIVFHGGSLWWCIKENGPDSILVTPGTNDAYWADFLSFLATGGGGKASFGNPVDTVIAYYGTTAPDGYFACNGSTFSATEYPELRALLGSSILPDLRGEFLRGLDSGRGVDPDTRTIGSVQGDAIRNITGTIDAEAGARNTGVFYSTYWGSGTGFDRRKGSHTAALDISRQVPTSTENRPRNVAVLYCIKHD